jgi:hypothetical protein
MGAHLYLQGEMGAHLYLQGEMGAIISIHILYISYYITGLGRGLVLSLSDI